MKTDKQRPAPGDRPSKNTIITLLAALLLPLAALFAAPARAYDAPAYDRAAAIAADLANGDGANILVTAHRGDWRGAPENSVRSINNAIAMGVDIVEIDVQRTADGHFVLSHDPTLDRATTGKGRVADHDLEKLLKLRLKSGNGVRSGERLLRLEEALELVRGRAMVNIDKSESWPEEVWRVVDRAGALGYSIFNITKPFAEMEALSPGLLGKMKYMPIVHDRRPGEAEKSAKIIRDYLACPYPPAIIQMTVMKDDSALLALIPEIRAKGVRVWINSLWPWHNGGHDDDRALTEPDAAYGWFVRNGVNIIQTDRPELLLNYLRSTSRRR